MTLRLGNRERLLATAVAALAVSASVFAAYGVVPGRSEVADPLGLPVRLVRTVTASADAFDRNTATLVDRNTTLGQRTAAIGGVASSLAQLQTQAAQLTTLLTTLDARTGGLAVAARPLPGGVDGVATRAQQGTAGVGDLQGGIADLGQTLGRLLAVLRSLQADVGALGPRAQTLTSALDAVRQDTAALGFLQSLLHGPGAAG